MYKLLFTSWLFVVVSEADKNFEINREVTGSTPVEVLTFSGFYTQLLKLRS